MVGALFWFPKGDGSLHKTQVGVQPLERNFWGIVVYYSELSKGTASKSNQMISMNILDKRITMCIDIPSTKQIVPELSVCY